MSEREILNQLARTRYTTYARLIMQDLNPRSSWKPIDLDFLSFTFLYLEDFANKEERNLVINLPPGFLKSTLILLMAAFLYLRDDARILILVRTDEARMRMMSNIVTVLGLPRTRLLFPSTASRRAGKSLLGQNGARITIQLFKSPLEETFHDFVLIDDPESFVDLGHVDEEAEKYISEIIRPTSETNSVLVMSTRVARRDASLMMVEWFGATHLGLGAVFLDENKLIHRSGATLQQKRLRMLCPEIMTWKRFIGIERSLEMWLVCSRYLSQPIEPKWTMRCWCAAWTTMMSSFGEIMISDNLKIPGVILDAYTAARKEEQRAATASCEGGSS